MNDGGWRFWGIFMGLGVVLLSICRFGVGGDRVRLVFQVSSCRFVWILSDTGLTHSFCVKFLLLQATLHQDFKCQFSLSSNSKQYTSS